MMVKIKRYKKSALSTAILLGTRTNESFILYQIFMSSSRLRLIFSADSFKILNVK